MKETKHTPVPWTVGETRHYKHSGGVDGTEVAVHHGSTDSRGNCIDFAYGHGASVDAEAEARLIAAAQDLLAALKEAELVLTERLLRLGADHNVSPMTHRIRAAIAKATGDA